MAKKNPFYDAFEKATKVDTVTLAADPFYWRGDKVKFFVGGKSMQGTVMQGTVNNCAGVGDCLVLGKDGKFYAGKDTSFELVK